MNTQPRHPLFRSEVFEQRADRLHGEIRIATPMSWHIVGYALLAILAVSILFLSLATYSRTETVKGSITLDRGVAPIIVHRHGVVTRVYVREGDRVRAGAPLAEIRSEDQMTAGGSGPEHMLRAMDRQEAGLASQYQASLQVGRAEAARLSAQAAGLSQELASIERQIEMQTSLVAAAAAELETIRNVADRGFISRRDVVQREENILLRRQQLAQLEQIRSAKRGALAEAQRSIATARGQAAMQSAGLNASRAQISQERIQTQIARGLVITAPVDGFVTAIATNAGQSVGDDQPLMTVVPRSSSPTAELEIPTSAVGFVTVGQPVRLSVDAFPYQRFGTVDARIVEISATTVGRPGPSGSVVPVYLATAEIRSPYVVAFGTRHRLMSGMVLSARIVTRSQSLIEWLFEPLFAVGNR
jgi:membrane fusion protein